MDSSPTVEFTQLTLGIIRMLYQRNKAITFSDTTFRRKFGKQGKTTILIFLHLQICGWAWDLRNGKFTMTQKYPLQKNSILNHLCTFSIVVKIPFTKGILHYLYVQDKNLLATVGSVYLWLGDVIGELIVMTGFKFV